MFQGMIPRVTYSLKEAEADFATHGVTEFALNPAGGVASHGNDPEMAKALALAASVGPAMQKFERTREVRI